MNGNDSWWKKIIINTTATVTSTIIITALSENLLLGVAFGMIVGATFYILGRNDFEIRPRDERGTSYASKKREGEVKFDAPNTLEVWFVVVKFEFWVRYPTKIININLTHLDYTGSPSTHYVEINGDECKLDSSYRMAETYDIPANETAKIILSRDFYAELDTFDDLGNLKITIEASSSQWGEVKEITVVGRLTPRATMEIEQITYDRGTIGSILHQLSSRLKSVFER